MQSAYRITVADSPDGLDAPNLWDTGKVASDTNAFIRYGGRPLESRMRCHWRVEVWDESDHRSASLPAQWTMGLLAPSDWQARWIGLEYSSAHYRRPELPTSIDRAHWIWADTNTPGPFFFETSFHLEPAEVAALGDSLLEVLAAANAEVFLNGQPVCRPARARAWMPNFAVPVPVWIRPSLLHPGANRLRIEAVGRTGIGGDPHEPSPGIIASLRLDFGESLAGRVIGTDASWAVSSGEPGAIAARTIGPWGARPWHTVSHSDYKRFPARYVRHEFFLPAPPLSATLHFSGLGLSEAWINGRRVGDEVLSPPPTDFHRSAFYRSFDVAGLVREGANAAGVILGNGHLTPPRASLPVATRSFGYPKLLWQLEVACADGGTHVFRSSPQWKITDRGPVGNNSEFDGEEFRDDPAFDGWAEAGFDDSTWYRAEPVPPPGGPLKALLARPLRITETLRPVAAHRTKYGSTLFDFGRNLVGWCRVRAAGAAGTRLRLRHAETLESPDALSLDNLRTALCLDTAVLDARPLDWSPRFTFHGFRFVEARAECGALDSLEIEACDIHDDVPAIGHFACSDEILNKIVQAARRGILGNYRGFPTDCPQRDERMAWLGDRSRGCCGEMFLFDVRALYAKWMEDIADAQLSSGSLPDTAPAYWSFYNDSITWPSTLVFIPWFLHRQFGDHSTFRRHYRAIRRWLEFALSMTHEGIIERDTYGDWCVPPESPELIHSKDPARACHRAILASCYLRFSLLAGAEFARHLGESHDARRWAAAAEEISRAVHARFFDERRGCYDNGAQTASLLPLATGIVPPEHVASVVRHLAESVSGGGDPKVGVGMVGIGWLMRTLAAHGHCDLAFALATRTAYPSWGYMIERGATTIWELWNGDTAHPDMNSGNHVMLLGDLIPFLFEDLAGIQPAAPGFRQIALRPRFPEKLERVEASHNCPSGKIRSAWEKAGERVDWRFTIPANTTAVAASPAGWKFEPPLPGPQFGPGEHRLLLVRAG